MRVVVYMRTNSSVLKIVNKIKFGTLPRKHLTNV